jgi:hypothetical protein
VSGCIIAVVVVVVVVATVVVVIVFVVVVVFEVVVIVVAVIVVVKVCTHSITPACTRRLATRSHFVHTVVLCQQRGQACI